MKPFALCVGINHFIHSSSHDLAGCVPDAQAMQEVFKVKGASSECLIVLQDHQATKVNIMARLNTMVRATQSGAAGPLFVSFSTHGTQVPGNEADGYYEAIVCADIQEKNGDWDPDTIIMDYELHSLMAQVPRNILMEVWLDTCFSGGIRALDLSKRNSPRFLSHPTGQVVRGQPAIMPRAAVPTNNVIWTACSENQTSADAYIKSGYHGAFTWFWSQAYKAMSGATRADIVAATRTGLSKGGYEQKAHLYCNQSLALKTVGGQ